MQIEILLTEREGYWFTMGMDFYDFDWYESWLCMIDPGACEPDLSKQ